MRNNEHPLARLGETSGETAMRVGHYAYVRAARREMKRRERVDARKRAREERANEGH